MFYDEGKTENAAQEEETKGAAAETAIVEELQDALDDAKAKADANMAGWQRAAADLANYRKRSDQERSELVKNANADLIRRLLPVVDDMERALQTVPADLAELPWVEGVKLIERKMLTTLEQEGVTQYSALGQEFDPAFHDAVTVEPSDPADDGKVVGEMQKGYRLRDRVLRPALVRVGRGRTE